MLGEKSESSPDVRIPSTSAAREAEVEGTAGPHHEAGEAMSSPTLRRTWAKPHIPGLRRPQDRHCASRTPTSVPHEGHKQKKAAP